MSRRPWMAFYPADFQLDTLDLSTDEVGMYITMICLAWRHGDGSITGDMQELKIVLQRLHANLHGLTFNRIAPKLLARYFERRENGRYYQRRVEKELRKAEEISEKQKRNANKRWSASNKNNGIAHANAMPSQSQSQLHKKEESIYAPKKARRVRQLTPFPSDLALVGEPLAYALEHGWLPEKASAEWERFRNHAKANDRRQKDWMAAWRMWVTSPFQQSNSTRKDQKAEEWDNVRAKLRASIERDDFLQASSGETLRLLPPDGSE